MKKEFKIICKILFLPYWAAASFPAQPRRPARPASAPAVRSSAPRRAAPDQPQSSAAACPYAVVVAHRMETGGPRAPPVTPTPTAPRLPPSPPSHLLLARTAAAAHTLASSTARTSAWPELAVSGAPARRRPPHLALCSSFTSCIPC